MNSTLEKTSIDICIATYKRPLLLKKLLESLIEQTIIETHKIRVIIIDNDANKSAETVVESFFKDKKIEYIYDVQLQKNISLTRNKALEYANADYLAFIDDDEWAASDWLETLLTTSIKYDADVVFGSVNYKIPPDAPNWIREGGFFKINPVNTGDLKQYGASNNTLVRSSVNNKFMIKFDPEYGLTGGEDTEFFYRLYLTGARLISCKEAIVYEAVAYERMKISWLVKRSLRSGQVYAKIFNKNQKTNKIFLFFLKRSIYLAISIMIFPFSLLLGRAKWVWVLRKIMANLGQLSMLLSDKPYEGYK